MHTLTHTKLHYKHVYLIIPSYPLKLNSSEFLLALFKRIGNSHLPQNVVLISTIDSTYNICPNVL